MQPAATVNPEAFLNLSKNDIVKNARQSLIESEHQLKDLGQILKYAEQYKANRIYHIRYRKSKNPDAYLQRHETELLLHDGAKNMLQHMGIDVTTLDLDTLRNEYNLLYAKKQKLQQTYKATETEIASLQRKLVHQKRCIALSFLPHHDTPLCVI